MIPLVIGPRPRFADALGLMQIDLEHKARVELQLDAATVADFDERDHAALGQLILFAALDGRPFVALLTVVGHPAPYVALVSYDARIDSRAGDACRVCGCVDEDCASCIERTGAPCSWAEPDLCSACEVQP